MTDPVIGWRVWALAESAGSLRLTSVVYADEWVPRKAFARRCHPGGCLAARWPMSQHSCGIYAFKRRDAALDFPVTWDRLRHPEHPGPQEFVLGRVSLWGRVIEHVDGFRGQRAYPYELFLTPAQRRFVRPLASTYAVDVSVTEESRLPTSL